VRPTSGQILFRGKDISRMLPHEPGPLGHPGIKTQVPSLFNGLSVWENVWLSASRVNPPQRSARRDADDARAGRHARRQPVAGRAAGACQRQWVELAWCSRADPPLILLDEPAAA